MSKKIRMMCIAEYTPDLNHYPGMTIEEIAEMDKKVLETDEDCHIDYYDNLVYKYEIIEEEHDKLCQEQLKIILLEIILQVQQETMQFHIEGRVKKPEKDLDNYYIPEIIKLFSGDK